MTLYEINLHAFGKAFRKLGNIEFQIFELLFADPFGKFHGTYTDLAKELGMSASNVRKGALKLVEYGVIGITKNDPYKKPIFFLTENWAHALVANTAAVKNPHEKIKRPRKTKAENERERLQPSR